jgi:zinc protease
MCFNGTENFPKMDIKNYLESIGTRFGAHLNAYTSFDETVYELRVPTDDPEKLAKALQILEDWSHRVLLEGEEIEKERGVVVEEWRTRLGAGNRLNEKTLPVIFYQSRYAQRLPIGQKELLDTFPHEALRRFYRDWYRPDLMAVVAVGDFNADTMERMIRAQFSQVPAAASSKARELFPVPDHAETLVSIASDPEATSNQVRLLYKHETLQRGSESGYRQGLAYDLLSEMMIARLGERSREAQPPFRAAYAFYSEMTRSKDNFTALALVADEGFLGGLEALLTENERALRFGFTASELERARRSLLSRAEEAFAEADKTPSEELSSEYVEHFLSGAPAPGAAAQLELFRQWLPGIMLEEVNEALRRLIREESRVVVITGREKEGNAFPSEAEVRALFGKVKAMALQPYEDEQAAAPLMAAPPAPGSLRSSSPLPAVGGQLWELSNGLKVLVKPTDFQNDRILVQAFSPGGTSLYADSLYMSASRAAEIVAQCGLGPYTRVQLEKYLSDKVVSLSPYLSELEEGFSGNCRGQDFELMLQMIHLYFTAPRQDETAFLSWKTRLEAQYVNLLSSPGVWFRNEVQKTLYQGHPRRQVLPSAEQMASLSLARAHRIFRERFSDADDFTFVFTGSLPENAQQLIETYLGSLEALPRSESWRDLGIESLAGEQRHTFRKGKEPQSQVMMMYRGPFEWSVENAFQLEAACQVLSMRLLESMRENQGGVYGVSAFPSVARDPQPRYQATVFFSCSPGNADTLAATVRAEALRLAAEGPSAEEVAKVQEILRKEYSVSVKDNSFWAEQLQFALRYGLDLAFFLDEPKRIDGLSAAGIQAAAKRYFSPSQACEMRLMPEL